MALSCERKQRSSSPRVKQGDLRQEIEYYDISVTMDSPTTFTIKRLRVPDPAPGTAESYTGSGTLSYDENGDETITGLKLTSLG